MHHFLRRGRAVSDHELELAMGRIEELEVVNSMFGFERRRNPALWTAWRAWEEARFAGTLRRWCPRVHPTFFAATPYVLLRKT
jgi:hypothetical protein